MTTTQHLLLIILGVGAFFTHMELRSLRKRLQAVEEQLSTTEQPVESKVENDPA